MVISAYIQAPLFIFWVQKLIKIHLRNNELEGEIEATPKSIAILFCWV